MVTRKAQGLVFRLFVLLHRHSRQLVDQRGAAGVVYWKAVELELRHSHFLREVVRGASVFFRVIINFMGERIFVFVALNYPSISELRCT